MPPLERDLELQVRRENALEHAHLFLARQALYLSSQLIDHLARRCHGTRENTAKMAWSTCQGRFSAAGAKGETALGAGTMMAERRSALKLPVNGG
jgi:hypothetical protein